MRTYFNLQDVSGAFQNQLDEIKFNLIEAVKASKKLQDTCGWDMQVSPQVFDSMLEDAKEEIEKWETAYEKKTEYLTEARSYWALLVSTDGALKFISQDSQPTEIRTPIGHPQILSAGCVPIAAVSYRKYLLDNIRHYPTEGRIHVVGIYKEKV